MAHHFGSAFGRVGQIHAQPSTEYFANLVVEQWMTFDTHQLVFIEDEGRHIGSVNLPENLYSSIRSSPDIVCLDIPRNARISMLCDTYNGEYQELEDAIMRLSNRLGKSGTEQAMNDLCRGNYEHGVDSILDYYDGAYTKHLYRGRDERNIHNLVYACDGADCWDTERRSNLYIKIASDIKKHTTEKIIDS